MQHWAVMLMRLEKEIQMLDEQLVSGKSAEFNYIELLN